MVRVVQMFPPISVRSFQIASGDKLFFPQDDHAVWNKTYKDWWSVYLDCTRHPSY